MHEVPVGGEDLLTMSHGDGAHQHIYRSGPDSKTSAQIARPRSFLIVAIVALI
jgi:hypothetical protein